MTSTILDVNIDRSDPLPLHEQVVARIRRAIADGEAGPGERFPLAQAGSVTLLDPQPAVARMLDLLCIDKMFSIRRRAADETRPDGD